MTASGAGNRLAGLSTPQPAQYVMQPVYAFEKPPLPTFSDGEVCNLRHAPRKRKGTGEALPAPSTPATVPKHWNNPAPGEKPKPKPEEPVPDFNQWRKIRKTGESGKKPLRVEAAQP